MASYDKNDSTSLNVARVNFLENLVPSVRGLRIGLVKECTENLSEDTARVFAHSVDTLKQLGATFVELSVKSMSSALPCYYIIAPAEASSNLARYDGVRYGFRAETVDSVHDMYAESRRFGFGKEVRRRILIGTFVLSREEYDSYYLLAQKVRRLLIQEFDLAFADVDLILTPTTVGGAFGIEEGTKMSAIEMYLNDLFTVSVNMIGCPAISVPAGESSEGLPLGVQFIGQKLSEQKLFNAAAAFEEASSGWSV
jgi:aspartyl-tRNA(Asn)/glutamyl-tRNA(Gln) amidotransferase subunit A